MPLGSQALLGLYEDSARVLFGFHGSYKSFIASLLFDKLSIKALHARVA